MPFKPFQFQPISNQEFSSHRRRRERGPAPSAAKLTKTRPSDAAQKIPIDRDDSKKQNDLFDLFQTFADPQRNYERYGGPNLLQNSYKQAFQHFNGLNAAFSNIDKAVMRNYMAQKPDHALFHKLKEIADLRRNYVRTVGSKDLEERTDQSAVRLRAEGLFAGLPRLLRNARRETNELKQARKQNPYTSRSTQFLREETRLVMQNAPFFTRLRFSLSPTNRAKEQLRVLMRWLKLSETDRLSPRPFLAPSSREDLKHALVETHQELMTFNRVFQVCKAVCIIIACALFAWKAGSDLIERWQASKRQAALEQIPSEERPSLPSKVTADVGSKIRNGRET